MKILDLIRFPKNGAPSMSQDDKSVIEALASGDNSKRSAAVSAHRRNIPLIGVRGNAHQCFMAEIDNPKPDITLRAMYRQQILAP